MIGPKPTLQDVVLHLHPEPVDLFCYEQLSDSSEDEDEDQVDHHQQARPAGRQDAECFRIVTDCHTCGRTLRLVVHSSHEELEVLEELLMGSLELVCPTCADRV
ncbi:E7 [Macaca fascicularis papillomavirus 10]|uniref:Protein E7 n=1 Tax=Macaca fascicularis papillomavirus 10 TaxID=524653 RepID=C3RUC2_RHPV1|nr:E7 [Macaca fascicularis papillomavirus 10]